MNEELQELVPEEIEETEEVKETETESTLDALKENVISAINDTGYDLELKKALIIAAQEHFDSPDVMEARYSGNIDVSGFVDKLWNTFDNYIEYKEQSGDPASADTEVDFRTSFISHVSEMLMGAAKEKYSPESQSE